MTMVDSNGVAISLRKLTNFDRCDRCGAKAQVLVGLPHDGELTFCGHHAAQHAKVLVGKGYIITSEREQ